MRRHTTKQPKGPAAMATINPAKSARSRKSSSMGVPSSVMVMFVIVVMFVLVKRQRAARTVAKERAIFRRVAHHMRRARAADMPVQANHAVRRAHHHVQVMADRKNRATQLTAHVLDQAVKR